MENNIQTVNTKERRLFKKVDFFVLGFLVTTLVLLLILNASSIESHTSHIEVTKHETIKEINLKEKEIPQVIIEKPFVEENPFENLKTQENLDLLAKIIAAEYRSQKEEELEHKVAIGIVVLNRVLDDNFPDTVREVIFQKNQFQPTFDGTWDKIEPTEFDYKAAKLALNNYRLEGDLNNALYFMNPKISNPKNVEWFRSTLNYVGTIDQHEFYY